MTFNKMTTEILEALFEGYKTDGGGATYSIAELVRPYNLDLHSVGGDLVSQLLVKNQNFLPRDFTCGITEYGISKVNPNYFTDHIATLVNLAGQVEDWVEVKKTLGFGPKDTIRAMDIAKMMEHNNIAEATYMPNEIHVKLTARGIDRYRQQNEGGFLHMK